MRIYKILLVDGNPLCLQLWRAILSQMLWSYKLDWAVSEKNAGKFLATTSYDIIISDFSLSKILGQKKCSIIFTHTDKLPSIIGNEDHPYYFLKKPLDMGRGMQLIHQLVSAEGKFEDL